MTFASLSFVLFFGLLFLLYYLPIGAKRVYQNWLLLLASYFFYGFADWKISPVILIATAVFYGLGRAIQSAGDGKRAGWYTTLAVFLGVGLLLYFKYFNFFIDSFAQLINAMGFKASFTTLNIIVPLGISYFTFKLISYVVEVNRGKLEASRDFVGFATYVAFFPTILSGPIDRPNTFLPQLEKKRTFSYELAVDGCRQILWGLFQKTVIADSLATMVSEVWADIPGASGSTLVFATFLFSVQLYTDFAGYSHMAIGVGKILGFRVTSNFNYPFFARSIPEFWGKWHISLTSWITEYVFMPLNIKFRGFGKLGIILAIMINLVLVGLWHGANWTFVIFGLFHGLLFIPHIMRGSFFKKKKLKPNRWGLPRLTDFIKMIWVFLLISFSVIWFKASDIQEAVSYIGGIIDRSILSTPMVLSEVKIPLLLMLLFFVVEWFTRGKEHALTSFELKWKGAPRWSIYLALAVLVFLYSGGKQLFIYSQF